MIVPRGKPLTLMPSRAAPAAPSISTAQTIGSPLSSLQHLIARLVERREEDLQVIRVRIDARDDARHDVRLLDVVHRERVVRDARRAASHNDSATPSAARTARLTLLDSSRSSSFARLTARTGPSARAAAPCLPRGSAPRSAPTDARRCRARGTRRSGPAIIGVVWPSTGKLCGTHSMITNGSPSLSSRCLSSVVHDADGLDERSRRRRARSLA